MLPIHDFSGLKSNRSRFHGSEGAILMGNRPTQVEIGIKVFFGMSDYGAPRKCK
jgi:hypothetical protein